MASQVICVSRTAGAGAEEVAANVARRLGFRHVDDQIVLRAAAHAGVSAEEVAAAKHRQPLIDRIVGAFMFAGSGVSLPAEVITFEGIDPSIRDSDYERIIRGAIEQTADEGNATIVAHAASMALAGAGGVLRVLITASPETPCRPPRSVRGVERERRPQGSLRLGQGAGRLSSPLLRHRRSVAG